MARLSSNGGGDTSNGCAAADAGVSDEECRGSDCGNGDDRGAFNDSVGISALPVAKGLKSTDESMEGGNAALKVGGEIGDVVTVVVGSDDGCVVGEAAEGDGEGVEDEGKGDE